MALPVKKDPQKVKDDLQLMQLVAARDRNAQKELATRLVDRVGRLCRILLSDQAEADDCAQQALVEILRSAGNFGLPGKLEAWADTITVRTTLKAARRRRESQKLFQQLPNIDELAAFVGDFRRTEILPQQLQLYLNRIAAPKREAFVMKHALGYTVEEIAELSHSPRGTVKDRLVAAKKELRRMLARESNRKVDF